MAPIVQALLNMQPARQFIDNRAQMVRDQLQARGVTDQRVLDAMAAVPRHDFVSQELRGVAYSDRPLPIGSGQTISQPQMVGTLLEALELRGDETVLDVGTGSGYQAALLARLAGSVVSVEIIPELAASAQKRLRWLGYPDVEVVVGDGSLGWPGRAPYEAIVVAAGAPRIPAALVDQLADGGRLVIPVGERAEQQLLRVRKHQNALSTEQLVGCFFVPLVGRAGWAEA